MKTQITNQTVIFFDDSKINILNSKEIETKIMKIAETSDSKPTLNFSNIKFIDSTGFSMLMKIKSFFNFGNISDEAQELFTLVEFSH